MELIGLLLPPLIDLINRKINDADARFWISVFACAFIGAGLNFIDTQFAFATPREAFDSLTISIAAVFGLAQLSYKAFYEGSKVEKAITGDENVVRE